MPYLEFLNELRANAEPKFADFQRRLIFTDREILGVRTPKMREIAKKNFVNAEEVLQYPNEYYETVFIKLTIVSMLDYSKFIKWLPKCIGWMDSWALCDSFKAKCIRRNKDEFLLVLDKLFESKDEYNQRYPLVVLLSEYVEEKYMNTLKRYLSEADTSYYYVHMAAAWLLAEILIKHFNYGVSLLQDKILPVKTHNKAIQKAIESFRLNYEQKEYLRSLKL